MTKLPEQRRPVAGGEPSGSGGHAKAFARTTFVERDARTIAEWTAAPNEIAETEKRLFLAAQEAKYAAPASTSAEDDALRRSVEQVAGASRGKTLLEKHQEREARAAKAARDAARAAKKDAKEAKKAGKGSAGAGDEGDDGTGWSYRPWNRETDLEAGRVSSTKALSAGELLEKAGGDLKGRFGRGGTEGGGR